jgi:hypothetical protein
MLLVSTRSDLSELSFPELRSVVAAAVAAVTAASPGVAVTA